MNDRLAELMMPTLADSPLVLALRRELSLAHNELRVTRDEAGVYENMRVVALDALPMIEMDRPLTTRVDTYHVVAQWTATRDAMGRKHMLGVVSLDDGNFQLNYMLEDAGVARNPLSKNDQIDLLGRLHEKVMRTLAEKIVAR